MVPRLQASEECGNVRGKKTERGRSCIVRVGCARRIWMGAGRGPFQRA